MCRMIAVCFLLLAAPSLLLADDAAPLRIAPFQADVTPPLGSPLCDGLVPAADTIVDPLTARGVVLLVEPPIVLCAVDWVGIGGGGHDAWREALAAAAGTTADRVAVHSLHPHDAPGCDFAADDLLAARGLGGKLFNVVFAREAIGRTADAIRASCASPRNVTHIGAGQGEVKMVASNRRLLGADGRVQYVRYSSCKDEAIRALPEGTIDPMCKLLAFYDGDEPVAAITWYATHPQSYYGQGDVSADFVGLARSLREEALPGVPLIHFNGAGGNVAAGKYNDGTPPMRPILAERLAAGMRAAWESQVKTAVTAADVALRVRPIQLPVSERLKEDDLLRVLDDSQVADLERMKTARALAYARRAAAGMESPLTALRIGPAWIVHMPGELFVEYQLAAQAMRPGEFVAMAAYGDYSPGYIGTEIGYSQGGYETGPVSRVAPSVEGVLMQALQEMMNAD